MKCSDYPFLIFSSIQAMLKKILHTDMGKYINKKVYKNKEYFLFLKSYIKE